MGNHDVRGVSEQGLDERGNTSAKTVKCTEKTGKGLLSLLRAQEEGEHLSNILSPFAASWEVSGDI